MPIDDLSQFNPIANITQRNYSNSGVLWPSTTKTLNQAVEPGTWKSGYPDALSPFQFFVWFDQTSNFKNGPLVTCTRQKTRVRVFIVDLSEDNPVAVDVTGSSLDWPSAELNTAYVAYDPSEFSSETSDGGGSLVSLEDCDCELPPPIFDSDLPLAFGHTVAPKVVFGDIDEVT
jgi:hypothetical protein